MMQLVGEWNVAGAFARAVVAGSAVVVLFGCATLGPNSAPEAKQAAVTERAKARWNAELKGDLDASYTFLSPATRQVVSLATYKTRGQATRLKAAEVESVKCEGAACRVRVLVTYDHRLMKGITTPIEEDWIIEDGQAWYVHR